MESGHTESLSWDLGNRVTSAADATRLLELTQPKGGCECTVFEVTDHTCVVRFRTPVGREKFFGIATADLRDDLETAIGRNWNLEWVAR